MGPTGCSFGQAHPYLIFDKHFLCIGFGGKIVAGCIVSCHVLSAWMFLENSSVCRISLGTNVALKSKM